MSARDVGWARCLRPGLTRDPGSEPSGGSDAYRRGRGLERRQAGMANVGGIVLLLGRQQRGARTAALRKASKERSWLLTTS